MWPTLHQLESDWYRKASKMHQSGAAWSPTLSKTGQQVDEKTLLVTTRTKEHSAHLFRCKRCANKCV